MFRTCLIVVAALAISSASYAEQADPAFLQRAVQALQAQRNAALDAQAVAEAKVAGLTEDLNTAKLRIKGFEDKQTENKESDKK